MLATVALALVACGVAPEAQSAPTLTPGAADDGQSGGVTQGVARVDAIEVLILESFPVQVQVVARGNLRNGCVTIASVDLVREGQTFRVTIGTEWPTDVACTEALVPYEETISLPVSGLTAGTYAVDVNGVRDTFELSVDNVLPGEGDASEQDLGRETSGAIVDRVDVERLPDKANTIRVVVRGSLRDGCTEIVDAVSSLEGDRVAVDLLTERAAGAMCTQALVPFETELRVDVSSLRPGEYVVVAGEASASFVR
jgi:hypothetical protein